MILQSYDPHPAALPPPVVPTPVPLPPARYASRDVSVTADDGVTLAGTLTIPNAAARPLPGFVFVHGSGCIDRDETIGPNKIFAQLANRLSNDGYAVLRYDKRSCGKSGGEFATRDRLIADARAVIASLASAARDRPEAHLRAWPLRRRRARTEHRDRRRPLSRHRLARTPGACTRPDHHATNASHGDRRRSAQRIEREEGAELDAIASGKKAGAYNDWLRSSFGSRSCCVDRASPLSDLDRSRRERHSGAGRGYAASRQGGARGKPSHDAGHASKRRPSLHQAPARTNLERRRILYAVLSRPSPLYGDRKLVKFIGSVTRAAFRLRDSILIVHLCVGFDAPIAGRDFYDPLPAENSLQS